jgi:putative phage-type endonuclease
MWNSQLVTVEPIANPIPEMPDTTISASEIAAVMGISPWRTPYGLWAQKNGLAGRPETKEQRRGKRLERVVLEMVADDLEINVTPSEGYPGPSYIDPDRPWATCRPDGFAMLGDQRLTIEAKTSSQAKEWGDPSELDAPLHYMVQKYWQMLVCKADAGVLAGLILGENFKRYMVPRNEPIETELVQRAEHFRAKYLLSGTPPELDASEDARRWLTSQWLEASGKMRAADLETERLIGEWKGAREQLKKAEDYAERLANQVRAVIGGDDGIIYSAGKVTWKWQNGATRVDTTRLKAEAPDIYARFAKSGEPSRVLRIT